MKETFPIRVALRVPRKHNGMTISEIILREPRAGDYFKVVGEYPNAFIETRELISLLSERTVDELAALDPRDYFELVEIVRPFSLAWRFQEASEAPAPTSPPPSDGAGPSSPSSHSRN